MFEWLLSTRSVPVRGLGARNNKKRLAAQSIGYWVLFLLFSIAILSLIPRSVQGI